MNNKLTSLVLGGLALLGGLAHAQPGGPGRLWLAAPTPQVERLLQALPDAVPAPLTWETLSDFQRLELQGVQTQMFTPPRAARAFALLSVALNDTLAILGERRGAQRDVAAAYAAREAVLYLHPIFPNLKDAARQTADAVYARAQAAGFPKAGLDASREVGVLVGRQVAAWGRRDGANTQTIPVYPPAAPGVWVWPLGRPAADPGWGAVKPIGVANEALPKSAPPPAWGSPEYEQERALFLAEQRKLDARGKAIADKWAGDPGTVTPAGLWQELAVGLLRQQAADAEGAVRVLAPLNVAMHNSFIACWKDKFFHYTARPNQWVATFDKQWRPYLRTPRFPAYPSGHSTVSGAAAGVLKHFFPAQAALFEGQAEEASYSRITGGIHWFVDGKGGLDLGRRTAEQVLGLIR